MYMPGPITKVFLIGFVSTLLIPFSVGAQESLTISRLPATLNVAGATYTITRNLSSERYGLYVKAANVTIEGNGHTITINQTSPTGVSPAQGTSRALYLRRGANGAIVRNLKLRSADRKLGRARVLASSVQDLTLTNVEADDLTISRGASHTVQESDFENVRVSYADGSSLSNNEINYLRMSKGENHTVAGNSGGRIYWLGINHSTISNSSAAPFTLNTGQFNVFTNNSFTSASLSASRGATLQGNSCGRIYLRRSTDNLLESNTVSGNFGTMVLTNSSGNTVRDNRITATASARTPLLLQRSSNNILDRNIVWQSVRKAASVTGESLGNSFTNNTFFGGTIAFSYAATRANAQLYLRNNIFLGGSATKSRLFLRISPTSGVDSDYNSLYVLPRPGTAPRSYACSALDSLRNSHSGDANSICVDPMLSNPITGDFSLEAGSPAIDAGDPAFGTDFPGGRIDIGADEY